MAEDKKNEETKKKTTPAKKATKAKPKKPATKKVEVAKEEVVEEVTEDVVEEKPRTRRKAMQIDLNEMICVRSVTKGGVIYISPKTGMQVTWEDAGVEEYIEFGELLTMKASRPRFLNEPFIVVDDEECAEVLGLTKMYETIAGVDDLDVFFSQKPDVIEAKLDKVPKGIKKLIGDKSRELVQKGELFDIRKIKILESKLEIDLQMLMD